MIAIIDYGMGNLGSVKRKLDRIGVESVITFDPDVIRNSDKLILPGVGHFGNAINELKVRGLLDILNHEVLIKKKPILGICLGVQLMTNHSEEGDVAGFGWIDAEVIRFKVQNTLKFKVPHMGWNQVELKKSSLLFDEVDLKQGFYFVHSYHLKCNDQADVLNETVYEYPFVSAIQKDNIYGVQYHPEKSHEAGEQLLRNFVNLCIE
jgi:imidazole glycerol-phosphate synthase subunit HisH